jgi:chromosome segregation ATPase
MTRYLEIKPGSISETIKRLSDDYQAIFKKELEKTGKGIGSMTPDEKKAFFNKIDKMHNAKNEANEPVKPDDSKTTLVAAPGNKEKVIRIPKEKLADYKAKGYVEAESYIPEAKKVKEEELTAGQKKLPPALQKAIEKKDKKEEVEITETEGGSGGGIDALRAIKAKRQRLEGELERLNKDDPNYKEKAANIRGQIEKQKEIMASKQKEVYGSYDPSREDALDLIEKKDKNEETKMKDDPCWKDYKMIGMKKKNGKEVPNCVPKEEVEIKEGGMKEIDTNKKELERLNIRLSNLRDKKNASAGGDTTDVEKQIKQTEISVIDLKKKLSATKTEAVDPERVQKLNQKIASMTTKVGELDKSKPENKTKEAILKSDIATAKLRLQDLMQKSASNVKKAVNEASKAKQSYKSLKMSLKKEQEINNKKKTLTDKPITKIEVNPKIEG